MTQSSEAQKAISELNGTDLLGRRLNVNEARAKPWGREVVVGSSADLGEASDASPPARKDVRELIRMLSRENPRWGAPHMGKV
jgi:hypothetical protein